MQLSYGIIFDTWFQNNHPTCKVLKEIVLGKVQTFLPNTFKIVYFALLLLLLNLLSKLIQCYDDKEISCTNLVVKFCLFYFC